MVRHLKKIISYSFIYWLIFNYCMIYVQGTRVSFKELFFIASYGNESNFLSHIFVLIGYVLLFGSIFIDTMDEISDEKGIELFILNRLINRNNQTRLIINTAMKKMINLFVLLFISIIVNCLYLYLYNKIFVFDIESLLIIFIYCTKISMAFISIYFISRVLLHYLDVSTMTLISFMIAVILMIIDKVYSWSELFKFSSNPLTVFQPLFLLGVCCRLFKYINNQKKDVG